MDDTAVNALFTPPDSGPEARRFAAAAVAAIALHLAVLAIGIYSPTPRQMGEESGRPEGLTVEIVDASEMAGVAPSPLSPAPAVEPVSEPSPETPPPSPAEANAAPISPAGPATPDLKPSTAEVAPTPEPVPPPDKAVAVDDLDPNLFKIQPKAAEKSEIMAAPAEAKARAPTKQQPSAKPDKPQQFSFAVPTPSFSSNEQMPGRSAGVSRPEGITRSGLNDEFGRGVIRALRQTMPPNGQKAQATVRFVLSKDGNLTEVELVRGSGDPVLDQNVVFAVKQSNFPIPATNLTALDRQFRVTYVYR